MGTVADGMPWEPPVEATDQAYAEGPDPGFLAKFGAQLVDSSNSEWLLNRMERGAFEGATDLEHGLYNWGVMSSPELQQDPEKQRKMLQLDTTPALPAEEINRRYALPGEKITNVPMQEGIARLIAKERDDKMERDRVLAHYAQTNFWGTRMLTGAVAFMMDPLNAATAVIPGIGEDTILGGLARIGLKESLAARVAARGAAGFTAGAAAQAPISALHYALSQGEGEEYDMREALNDVFWAGAFNGALHMGIRTGSELLFGREVKVPERGRAAAPPVPEGMTEEAHLQALAEAADQYVRNTVAGDPRTHYDTQRSVLAQVIDRRPVDATSTFDEANFQKAHVVNDLNNQIEALRSEHEGSELAGLMERHEKLASDLNELGAARESHPSVQAARAEIETIMGKVGGVESRLTNKARERLADIKGGIEDFLRSETPEMVRAREELHAFQRENYEKMRDATEARRAYDKIRKLEKQRDDIQKHRTDVLPEPNHVPAASPAEVAARQQQFYRDRENLADTMPEPEEPPVKPVVPPEEAPPPEKPAAKPAEGGKPAEGEKPAKEEEGAAPSIGAPSPETAARLADAKAKFDAVMKDVKIPADVRAMIKAAADAMEHADETGQALAEGAACLVEAGV